MSIALPSAPFSFAIDWLSGLSPVEAGGRIADHSWYFRGKGDRWELIVSLDQRVAPIDLSLRFDAATGFGLSGSETDSGSQSEARIRALIAWAALAFHQSHTTGDLAICCQLTPTPQLVTERLAREGYRLVFQMAGETAQSGGVIPALPAQYHYRNGCETEVLLLVGRDRLEPGLPSHASRFWFTRGNDTAAWRHIISVITREYPAIVPRVR